MKLQVGVGKHIDTSTSLCFVLGSWCSLCRKMVMCQCCVPKNAITQCNAIPWERESKKKKEKERKKKVGTGKEGGEGGWQRSSSCSTQLSDT